MFQPASAAHGNVSVVAADAYLRAFRYDFSAVVHPRVDGRLCSAGADRLDLADGLGNFKQPLAAGKQVRRKVGSQPKAQNGNILVDDNVAELIHLLRR